MHICNIIEKKITYKRDVYFLAEASRFWFLDV